MFTQKMVKTTGKESMLQNNLGEGISQVNGTDPLIALKLVLVPKERNKFQLRLQNLLDTFDSQAQFYAANMTFLANAFWLRSNRLEAVPKYTITEMSLTGNMPKSEMD